MNRINFFKSYNNLSTIAKYNAIKKTILPLTYLIYFLPILGMKNNQLFPSVPNNIKTLKKALNNDFYENAKINGIVSYIYYPTGEAKQGHSELEIEGSCWGTIFAHEEFESLERKIIRSTTKHPLKPWRNKGRFFKQYLITISPIQLKLLKKALCKKKTNLTKNLDVLQEISTGLTYKTCSYNVLTILSKNSDFNIPMPFKISPFLTELYIKSTKPSQIKEIKEFGKKNTYDGEIFESSVALIILSVPTMICHTITLNYL